MQNTIIITEKDLLANPKYRLDSLLSACMQIPRSQAAQLIKNAQVCLNHTLCLKPSTQIALGDCISVKYAEPQIQSYEYTTLAQIRESKPEFEQIQILYQDSDLLIINKPPQIVIHQAPSLKEPTLVDWLKLTQSPMTNLCGDLRYGIVHRLDRQTSGTLAIARSIKAHNALSQQLKTREMGRYYLAVIDNPLKEITTIECYMGRHPKNRLKMTKLADVDTHTQTPSNPHWRYSKSIFIPLLDSHTHNMQLVAIKLFTGRTHQIRTHLESIHRHILGDKLYGYRGRFYVGRILLHSYLMYVLHPKDYNTKQDSQKLFFKAPLFADMIAFLQHYFDKDKLSEVLAHTYILDSFDCL